VRKKKGSEMNSEKLHYAFYRGCCFQGADIHWLDIVKEVMGLLDVELHVLEQGVCCGSGVIEERSELTSLAINARNMALAEKMGLPLFIPCATCYNVIANCRKVMAEDRESFRLVNAILKEEDLEYKGTGQPTYILWTIAVDVGLEKLAERVVTPLTGLRVAAYYGCHLRNPPDIQDYEPADHLTSLENILRVLGADVVDYDTKKECCGFHLTWPNREQSMKMTSNVLCGIHRQGVDLVVTACPLCYKSLDAGQPRALAATGHDFRVPVVFFSDLVGLACGMSREQAGLDWHVVPVNVRL
jgi:succinate dehydrogenase / fumarate reductase cytochrome b subunit